MVVEKKIITWEIVMTILVALMIFSPLAIIFLSCFPFSEPFSLEIFMFLPIFSFVLFLLIYFIFPQPFRTLLLKAKDILPKRDLIFFHHDLLKVKVSTEYLDVLSPTFSLSTSRDKGLQYHLQVSLMELTQEDQDKIEQERKSKTKYAKKVIFLNAGTFATFILVIVLGRLQIPILEKCSIPLFGLLFIFLYLRYSYNMYILLQFDKKLTQIEEVPELSYMDIRDLYK
jgi:hypothetical protein